MGGGIPAKIFITTVEESAQVEFFSLDDRPLLQHWASKNTTSAICSCTPQLKSAYNSTNNCVEIKIRVAVANENYEVELFQVEGEHFQLYILPASQANKLHQHLLSLHHKETDISLENIIHNSIRIIHIKKPYSQYTTPVQIPPNVFVLPELHYYIPRPGQEPKPCPFTDTTGQYISYNP